jgi:son of sevenless-like protein
MSSIISALSSVVITRLHLTWAHVGRKSQLDTLLKHNEPTGGFAGYRNLLSNVDSAVPCVPFITMYLTDLVRTREQFRDEPDRISFIQRQRWHETISLLLKFQRRQPQHIYNEYITAFISTQLREAIISADNSWFWAKSQEVQHSELANADFRDGLEQAGF